MTFLFFEFLGTTELMVILVAALVLFGPRKLPEISRQIGKSLAEFRKASDDFRQTWEREVNKEISQLNPETDRAMLQPESPGTQNSIERSEGYPGLAAADSTDNVAAGGTTETQTPVEVAQSAPAEKADNEKPQPNYPTSKREWL